MLNNNNPRRTNPLAPKLNGQKKQPAAINKKIGHVDIKNTAKKSSPQPVIDQSITRNTIISYSVIGLIIFIVAIIYFTSGNDAPKTEAPKPQETKKDEVKKKSDIPEGRPLTKQEQEQCDQSIKNLEEVELIIDKYVRMQKEDITESDKINIKNASKKMDEALSTLSELTENTGTQLLRSTRHNENRKKLTVMMMDLGISRN